MRPSVRRFGEASGGVRGGNRWARGPFLSWQHSARERQLRRRGAVLLYAMIVIHPKSARSMKAVKISGLGAVLGLATLLCSRAQPAATDKEPVTPIWSAGVKYEDGDAIVKVAIEADPAVTDFEIERGELVITVAPGSGIPTAPAFKKLEDPGVLVTKLDLRATEEKNQRVAVFSARLSGLPDGSRTYWRVVPRVDGIAKPPTPVILVDAFTPEAKASQETVMHLKTGIMELEATAASLQKQTAGLIEQIAKLKREASSVGDASGKE